MRLIRRRGRAGRLGGGAGLDEGVGLRGGNTGRPTASVRIDEVRLESPARAVVQAAADSDLLMVGRRKHPPALGPRLGAVVQAAVHHASCPVAVVPHE
ncbi:hypothetical protein M271_11785 [Streptomyces rapamycinicus NRRL 5491]|uniref:UspA domain-containing protein n=2 Tax=Streptomyces rapamycinicus TaxID=1226757 RepID=A0A0A0NAL1_STRRN|nr:hypothetical protein M271_11785 [Streptomyces rapamycinicus NRRL 5491]MBB4781446.1 nucleotide-binding universal stress UspA family protein [Streptomyces rapamycinicus]RLV73909.1 hypothetical protein D3C57_131825 [Streptomyces rapamycinicus NRRL 5491]